MIVHHFNFIVTHFNYFIIVTCPLFNVFLSLGIFIYLTISAMFRKKGTLILFLCVRLYQIGNGTVHPNVNINSY